MKAYQFHEIIKVNNGKSVAVNYDFIELGENGNGGYNKKQLEILGVNWPPKKGWKDRAIGKIIPYWLAMEYINLKGKKEKANKSKTKLPPKTTPTKVEPEFVEVNGSLSFEEQYRHPNWQRLRLTILQRDNFACRWCGDNQSQLHVHHLFYDKNKYVWEVKHKNLVTLCEKCHLKAHKKDKF